MARIKIRKVDGRWTSTVPGYGFTGQPRTQHHASHADALAAHTRTGATSGGSMGTAELAYTPVDQAHQAHQAHHAHQQPRLLVAGGPQALLYSWLPRPGGGGSVPRALKVCSATGCTELVPRGRCTEHTQQAEQRRGSAGERGYDRRHATRFRARVLANHPVCQLCKRDVSVHADHHPVDRATLVHRGEDPNDPRHGRGLCARCHSTETARHQPGGWRAAQLMRTADPSRPRRQR